MNLKTIFLGLFWIAIVFYLLGLWGYTGLGEMSPLERQTFVLLVNAKWLAVLGTYIAWRVTPEKP